MIYLSRKELRLSWQSRHWPTVRGHVTGKKLLQGWCAGIAYDGTGAPNARRWKELEVHYSYAVDGVTYTSSRRDFSGFGWGNEHYYRDGEHVTVYYCPSAPAVAVLHPGFCMSMFPGPVITLFSLWSIYHFYHPNA